MASLVDWYGVDEVVKVESNTLETAYVINTDEFLLEGDLSKGNPVYFYISPNKNWIFGNVIELRYEGDNEEAVTGTVIENGEEIFQHEVGKNFASGLTYTADYAEECEPFYYKLEYEGNGAVHFYLSAESYGNNFPPKTNFDYFKPGSDGQIYITSTDEAKDILLYVSSDFDFSITVNGKDLSLEEYEKILEKEGRYNIVLENKFGKNEYNVVYDATAPTVSGVKNNKTYKKAVTIKFSDKVSGIKSAKLNGKTIKSGKKITKAGKYTLKVTDKCGHVRTVKFTIKK